MKRLLFIISILLLTHQTSAFPSNPPGPSNADQVLSSVYDAVNNALRSNGTLAGGGAATPSNADQVLSSIYDATNNAIRINCVLGCGGGGGAPAWSAITAPTANLSIAHAAFTTTFTYGAATGAGVNLFNFTDTTNNTGTGFLLNVNLASGSAAKPAQFAVNGNGVQVTNAGLLSKVGTGGIDYPSLTNFPAACGANLFSTQIGTTPGCTQPAFTNLSGTATKAQLPATAVYTDQANTFGAFLQKFQSGGNFQFADPTDTTKLAQFDLSGFTTATTRTVTVANANSTTVVSDTGIANNFLTAISAGGVISKAQPGFSNLSGTIALGQTPLFAVGDLLGVNSTPALARIANGITGQQLVATNNAIQTWTSPGVAGTDVNAATYTVLCDSATALRDRVTTIRFITTAPTVTVPDPTASGCGSNFAVSLIASGVTVTVNRTSTAVFNIYNGSTTSTGQTTFTLTTGQHATLTSPDNANWLVRLFGGGTGTVTNIATTSPITGGPITTTGTIACGTCATTTNGGALSGVAPVALSAGGAISITGVAGQVLAGSGPAFTATPTLGVQNSTQGTLTVAGSAASAGQLILNIAGASANALTITPGANAGGVTLTGPTTGGTIPSTATSPITLSAAGAIACATCATTATGGAVRLSDLIAANATNTIANGNNTQIWNWAQTSNTQAAMTIGETSAATGGTTTAQQEVKIVTLAGSTAVPLNITGSLTGSQTIPALHVTPTWNTTGVVDAGILENVTNTASGTASLLMDLQVGGTSQFKVDKVGIGSFATSVGTGTQPSCTAGSGGVLCQSEGTAPTGAAAVGQWYTDSTSHEPSVTTNGGGSGLVVWSKPGRLHSTGNTGVLGTTTICAATAGACNQAGNYTIEWAFTQTGTACATPGPGGVTFLLTWTDQNATAHSAISLSMDDSASLTATSSKFSFTTSNATAWASGNFNIGSNGSAIQVNTGYTACTTGTGSYTLDAWVTRKE